MKHNTQQLEALFTYATEGIIVCNEKGIIQLANPAAYKLFGYHDNELINHPIEVLIPKNIAQQHTALRHNYNKKPAPRAMGMGRNLLALKKDGTTFPVEVSLSPYSSKKENFVIAFVIDITIRKQQENALKQQTEALELLTQQLEQRVKDRTLILEEALQQLEQSRQELQVALAKEIELNEMKSRFVSMASHEFRTPLATMLSSLTLVEKYGTLNDSEKQQKHISRIKESIKHLTDLLNDVLSLSKLEEGKITIQKETIQLPLFIQEIIDEVALPLPDDTHIYYQHTGLADLFTDKKALKIIVLNLLSNAIKFSTPPIKIEITTHLTASQFTLTVKDYGLGISDEDKENLFQRFFRAKNATNIQGTGLGLHIVAKYVELLAGEINFNSQLNAGTEFIITIPNKNINE